MDSLTAYDPGLHKNALSDPPKLVPFQEILSILTRMLSTREGVESILRGQMKAFQLSSSLPPKCASLPIQTAGQPPFPPLAAGTGAQVCIKTGYAMDDSVMVSKCAAGGGDFSGNTGSVSVYDQKSLRLKAVLCDEGLLTEIRTAAAAVLATRAAVRSAESRSDNTARVSRIGIVGGGVQAIWHLRLLAASGVIDPDEVVVVVKTRSQESAVKFIQSLKSSPYLLDQRFTMEPYSETGLRFKGCQVIHTVSPSRSPVVQMEDIDLPKEGKIPFLHISAIGSDSPGKCEISLEVLKAVDLCTVDSLLQTKERGEFQSTRWETSVDKPEFSLHEIGAPGVLDEESGAFAIQNKEVLEHGLFSIFDSSGTAMQDVQLAKMVALEL